MKNYYHNYIIYWVLGSLLLSSNALFSQNQEIADSIKLLLEEEAVKDSLYLERLKSVAFNEKDPILSIHYAEQLIALASDARIYPNLLLSGFVQKGNAERLQGNLEAALASYFKGLEIAVQINDVKAGGIINSTIADVYSISSDTDNALKYYNKAISILRRTNDSISLASALLNMGDEYFNHEAYNQALQYFKESGEIFRKKDYLIGTGYNLGNIGMVYASTDQHKLAEKNINEAIQILESLEDYYPVSVYLTYMSDIYMDNGNAAIALNYAHRSLHLAQKYGLKNQIGEANLQLSRLHEKMGNSIDAFNYYKNHIAYRDSVNNIETVQKLANLRTDYEISQKQIEVDLLNQQKKNQQIIVIASIVALFLIGLLALSLYRRNKFAQRTNQIIEVERNRAENLLLNILPAETALELKENGKVKANKFDSVTVLFTDFKDFSKYADQLTPEALVESVDFYYSKFDEIMDKFGLEKIKTIGDSYMCAGGLPYPTEDHAVKMVQAAIEIIKFVQSAKKLETLDHTRFDIRIGINTGPVVAGIVGIKKFAYDIWGDTVNIASRMESNSEPGKINVSANTYELIRDTFDCEYRGEMAVKNKGIMKMYFVKSINKIPS